MCEILLESKAFQKHETKKSFFFRMKNFISEPWLVIGSVMTFLLSLRVFKI